MKQETTNIQPTAGNGNAQKAQRPIAERMLKSTGRKIRKVLIVEDDPSARETLVRVFGAIKHLPDNGYVIKAVGSAEEALQIIKSEGIDFVLTDLQMPGMNGNELVKEIKRQFPAIRTALASGAYIAEDLPRVKEETGSDYVLKKPYDFDSILSLMKKLEGNGPGET